MVNPTNTPVTPNADKALVDVMAYYRRELTILEGIGWAKIINDFGDQAVVDFLLAHMELNDFAPKLSEALKVFAPGRKNPTAAYEELQRAVREYGPYRSPIFADPALPRAVILMGGWLTVNEQLPPADGSFESGAYLKRFEAMYAQANSDVLFQREVNSKVCGIHDMSKPAGLLGHSSPALHTSHQPGAQSTEVLIREAAPACVERARP